VALFHDVTNQLDVLTEALEDPGTDLQAVLAVLVDDLTAAVPSLLGLHLTITVAGDPVILSATLSAGSVAAASLHVPLDELTAGGEGGTVTIYAGRAGAFVGLAADIRHACGLDGQVVVDGHLDEPLSTGRNAVPTSGITGLREFSLINLAIGILIGQGRPPQTARAELQRRAEQAGRTLSGAAQQLLDQRHPTDTSSVRVESGADGDDFGCMRGGPSMPVPGGGQRGAPQRTLDGTVLD